MVNGKKIDSCVQLFDDDVVELGKFLLLPAEAMRDQGFSSQSTSLDYGDETVFVTRQNPAAPVEKKSSGTKSTHTLTVIKGAGSPQEVPLLGRSSVKIGKEVNCDLRVSAWFVANAQCYVINRDKKYYLVPQRSWSNTFVNGSPVKKEQQLRPGDIIQIRGVQIRFD
jgi:pSer/pThr/pTyr-binding forkhead associated (FHA) protein